MSPRVIVHLVCTGAFAGVERYVLSLATHQAQAGHDVTVVGGAREHMRPGLDEAGAAWLPGDGLRRARRSLRSLSPADAPLTLVTHMTAADVLGAWWSRRFPATLVSVRHFAAARGSRPLTRALLRAPMRRIDRQIAISQYVADAIESPATVVHTGVRSVDPSPTTSAPRERLALIAQRLEPEKDTATALRGWAAAEPAGWRLIVAGDGSERGALEALAAGDPSIAFIGMSQDVPALLRRAELLIAPTPREGLGLSVLEAMAHGVAVIAADGGGHRETAGAVPDPALFAPGDVAALASRLSELTGDAARRAQLGAALADLQRRRFDRDVQCERLTAAMLDGGDHAAP